MSLKKKAKYDKGGGMRDRGVLGHLNICKGTPQFANTSRERRQPSTCWKKMVDDALATASEDHRQEETKTKYECSLAPRLQSALVAMLVLLFIARFL